ncbi:MAG: VPLPA-CTERM sorting domain-containing protein [Nitrospira sp.]|nr:VPLPA-CTERM sorting domain-containing protein [Nitrospira sp.]
MKRSMLVQAGVIVGTTLGLGLAQVGSGQAATVVSDPAGLQSGISYEWQVTMGALDLAHLHGSVGAKSWAEPGQPVGAKGWTHTTDWVALDLSGLSGPTILTIELERGHDSGSQLFPAFTLYQGWETINSDSTNHTFNNTGAISWATNLTYIAHVANAGGPNGTDSGTGSDHVHASYTLNPGLYSIVFGGNPPYPPAQTGQHSFAATLTTSPVPVPAALWLFGSGIVGLAGLARRRMNG